jgi:hypothetical protein
MNLSRIHAALLLPLFALACEEPLEPGSKVDSFRVLAQQVDQPYAKPGEAVKFSSLSYDPQARPLSWLWASCENPGDSSLEGCLARIAQKADPTSAIFAMGEGQDAPELTIPSDALSSLPDEARRFASVGVVSAACPGDLSIAAGPGGLPFRCQEFKTGRDMALDEFIVGIKRINVRDAERNHNPVINGVSFDGVDWPEAEVKEVGFCDRGDFDYDQCPGAEKHALSVQLSPDSFETGLDSSGESFAENVVIQHYAMEGIFKYEVRVGNSPQNGWVARKAASGQTLTLWFVARDDRGGVGWTTRRVRVR